MEAEPGSATSTPEVSRLRRIADWKWPRRYPIVQFPNAPLAVALLVSLAARFTEDTANRTLRAVVYLALGVWAYEEARSGENLFRRALGTGFLIYLLIRLTSGLHT